MFVVTIIKLYQCKVKHIKIYTCENLSDLEYNFDTIFENIKFPFQYLSEYKKYKVLLKNYTNGINVKKKIEIINSLVPLYNVDYYNIVYQDVNTNKKINEVYENTFIDSYRTK